MARAPVPQIAEVALRPVAAPVDTFVQPARSRLLDVAESLAPLDRGLQEWSEARAKKQGEEEDIRSEAAFYSGSEPELAEGIRTGRIPPQYSPRFVRGFKNAQGNVAGGELRQKFNAAFDAWEGKNSDDPEAYDAFLQDFLKSNMGTEDPDILRGLLPSIREIQQNGRSRYIEYRAEQTYNGSLQANVASANQAIDDADDAGLASEKGTDYNAVFTSINKRREAFVAAGGKPEDFDKTMADALSLKVIEKQDPGLLKWFDTKVPGEDYTYADTPYGAKLKLATIENLEVIARRKEVDEAQENAKKDKAAEETATRSALEFILADPTAPLPEGLIEQGTRAIPDFRAKVAQWQKNFNDVPTDARIISAVTSDILNGGGEKAVIKAFEQGALTRREDVASLLALAKSVTDNKDRVTEALGSTEYKQIADTLRTRTIAKNDFGDPLPGMSNEGLEADFDLKRRVSEWIIKNPDASLQERSEYIAKVGQQLLGSLTTPEDEMFEAATYDRPKDMDFENPYSAGNGPVQGGEAEAADEEVSTEEEPTDAAADPDVKPFLDRMTPDQRKAFEAAAKAQGKTVEQLSVAMLEGNPEQRMAYDPNFDDVGNTDAREALFTEEDATRLLEQAETEDFEPDTTAAAGTEAKLLTLIKKHEAAGNYNAVYGNSKSKTDLSKFTLDGILGQQQAARRRGAKSTAIGGYQFIYKTLRGLKEELGLTGKEAFTPALQDRLAMQLLKRRGLDRFRAGTMSKRQFALRLSQEWASLPNPNTGRSFYAGDGLNASSVGASSVYAAMGLGVYALAEPEVAAADVARGQSLDAFIAGPEDIPKKSRGKKKPTQK